MYTSIKSRLVIRSSFKRSQTRLTRLQQYVAKVTDKGQRLYSMRTSEQILAEIEAYFGYVPPLFVTAQATPQVLDNLWQQTLSAYINNPLPALFKEKLLAYLSRYCTVPYFIIRHSCAMLSLGINTKQVLQLLESPAPTQAEITANIKVIGTKINTLASLNEPNPSLEKVIFSCCVYIFLNPEQDAGCRIWLKQILDLNIYNHLIVFLCYVKTCHQWVEAYPTLANQIEQSDQIYIEALRKQAPRLVEFLCNYNEIVRKERQNKEKRDRLAAEKKLGQNEDLFRQIIENIYQVFWIASPDKKHFYISPAYEEIWGLPRQQLYENQSCFLDSVHTEDRDRVIAAWPGQIQREFEVEYRIIRPDGQERWIRDRAFPILNAQGEIYRIVGIADDITERKQLQEELKESQQRLKFALEAARMGNWEWDILTNKITWSDNFKSLFGLEKGSFNDTYAAFINCIHPQDRKFVKQAVRSAIQAGAEFDIEFRVVLPNGTIRVYASKGYVFRNTAGNAVRMVGVDIDITKRKQMEEALRQSEERWQLAWRGNNDGIWDWNIRTSEVFFSARWKEMLGYEDHEISNHLDEWEKRVHPDDISWVTQALQDHFAKKTPFYITEHRLRCKDSTYKWILARGQALWDEAGNPVRMAGSHTDITERKRLEAEHQLLLAAEQAARSQAETANQTKDEFLAIVSHELRSPLNAVLGWTRLLRSRQFDADKTAHALEIIERNASLQAQLIEDILDISRIIRGKIHLDLNQINLISVIEAAIEVVHSTAENKNIQLNFNLYPTTEEISTHPASPASHSSPFLVSGDSVRLQQIIWNLLSNAIKFTPAGGRVDIYLERIDNFAQICIIDNGRGISPEFLPYVFERFRQADSTITRSQGGLGLGLAIVRKLVELHNGTIDAASLGEGQGATFTMKLPLLEDSRQEDERISLLNPQPSSLNELHILVVDDEADAREFVSTALEQYGAIVTAVASAAEALEVVEQLQPNVLVSDIGMPGENGYSLIRQLRKIEAARGGKIPAVALTAYVRNEDQVAAIAAGFQLHIPKPVDPAYLAKVVAKLAHQNSE